MRLLTFLPVLLTPAVLAQSTLLVPEQYPSIEQAFAAAADGDEISIGPGQYFETLFLSGKSVDLVGRHGAQATILDAQQAGRAVEIQGALADGTTLRGLTITGGSAYGSGGGVRVDNATVDLVDLIIRDNDALSDGAGVYLLFSDSLVRNCVIRDNHNLYWDGAGLWTHGGSPTITSCTIVGNSIPYEGWGAGIWDSDGGATISNCIVWDNDWSSSTWDIGTPAPEKVWHCCYGDGASNAANGNFTADPGLVDIDGGDVHLRAYSPCRDAGLDSARGMPPLDPDGNPRLVGAACDVGADEFAPHVYALGAPTPGGLVDVRAIGYQPGDVASAWLSSGLLAQPWPTPFGDWFLAARRVTVFASWTVPASGMLQASWQVPTDFPAPLPLYLQALAAGEFTPVDTLLVRE